MAHRSTTTNSNWIQSILFFLFNLLILIVPFIFTWVNDELFEFPKMLIVYGFTLLIVATWLSKMVLSKKFIFKRTFLDWPILIFLASQILATIFSMHPRTSIWGYYSRFHGGLLSTVSYILLFYAFVSNFQKKHLKNFVTTLMITALGISLYAIPEHFGHSPSCLLITGKFNVDCWVQDVQHRIFGTFGQPNWLAAYTVTLFPLGISLVINHLFANKKKLWMGVTSLLLLATLIFTGSRSGFLGLLASGISYLIGIFIIGFKSFKKSSLLGVALPILAIILILGTPLTPALSQLISNHGNSQAQLEENGQQENQDQDQVVTDRLSEGGTDSGEIRMIVWRGALQVWLRYPILGSGLETFAYSYYRDRPTEHNLVSEWDFLYNKAHNEFLNYLATTGIVGLGSYLLLLGAVFWLGFKLIFETQLDQESRVWAVGLVSGLLALNVSNFFGFSTVVVSLIMWLYIAILVVLQQSSSQTTKSKQLVNPEPTTIQYVALAVIILLALLGINRLYHIWRADYLYAQGKNLSRSGYISASIPYLQQAIEISPQEALYYDELANNYSHAAILLAEQSEATQAAQVAQAAIATSDQTLKLNPVHLNFYKTRARILLRLSELEPELVKAAQQTLQAAIELSPTDAKLYYNLGVVENALGDTIQAQQTFEKALQLKPDYGDAQQALEELTTKTASNSADPASNATSSETTSSTTEAE